MALGERSPDDAWASTAGVTPIGTLCKQLTSELEVHRTDLDGG